MDLTDPEIKALASVLAARLGTDLAPVDPSDAPARGDTPADRWERKLRHANAKGNVARVVQIAARALPDDPVLSEANALVTVEPPVGSTSHLPALLGATAAALVVSTFGGMMTAVALASSSPAVTTPEPVVLPAAADAPAEPAPSASGFSTARPCEDGGWVYAGADKPVGTFVAPIGLLVRSAPLGEKVGCALREGAVVEVDEASIAAIGDRYWLHVSPANVPVPSALVQI